MRSFERNLRVVVSTMLATLFVGGSFVAGTASAQEEIKLDQMGAALALPLLSASGNTTYLTVTNAGPDPRNLHFNAIADDWRVTDFDCPVTPSETVLITFRRVGERSAQLILECNYGGVLGSQQISRILNFLDGILFIANETHECKDGTCTTNANDLFGDFVVVNAPQGFAYSSGAVPFQGKDPLVGGVTDRDYKFNNGEYTMFPATLASNFVAPGFNPFLLFPGIVTADLILFTLDGRANIGSQASLDIVFYDDDENPTSAHYTFDCFTIVRLEEIDPNFLAPFLGSGAGHFYGTVIDSDQSSNVHDNKFGNGNSIRVVGVHGWIFQTISSADLIEVQCIDEIICEKAAWARTLAQGMMPQDVDGTDVPTFDGL